MSSTFLDGRLVIYFLGPLVVELVVIRVDACLGVLVMTCYNSSATAMAVVGYSSVDLTHV